MNRTAWISLLAAALLVGPGRALGEETLEYEMAKTHYDLGAKYYQQGNYEIALDEFGKAYKLEPRPALRFNIGRCQEAMGQGEEAIASYEAFLKAVPGTPERRAVELRIQNIRQRLKEREGDKQPAGEEGAAGAVALIWDWQQARGRQHEAPSPEAALAVQVTPAGVAVTF